MHSADTVFRYVVIHVYFIVIIDRLACSELCCIRNAMMNSVELFSINVGLYKGQLLTTSEEKWHREYYTGAVLCIETTTRYRSIDSDNPFFNVSKKHMLLLNHTCTESRRTSRTLPETTASSKNSRIYEKKRSRRSVCIINFRLVQPTRLQT